MREDGTAGVLGRTPPGRALLDRALRAAAGRAAYPGQVRYTERQLYYELGRVLRPWLRAPRRPPFTLRAALPYGDFRAALARAGELPGLLPPPGPPATGAGRHTPEPDLFDYGLPRLLVCASDAIARMLRANGLPMESACPVFGAGELPLDRGVVRMLGHAERPAVFVLHDASAAGLAFPAGLAGRAGLPDGVRIVPLGLRPRQAGALHLAHRREASAGGAGAAAGGWEGRWLARGRCVEVAAVRPAALLRTVHRMVREVGPRTVRPPGLRRSRATGFLSWPAA